MDCPRRLLALVQLTRLRRVHQIRLQVVQIDLNERCLDLQLTIVALEATELQEGVRGWAYLAGSRQSTCGTWGVDLHRQLRHRANLALLAQVALLQALRPLCPTAVRVLVIH